MSLGAHVVQGLSLSLSFGYQSVTGFQLLSITYKVLNGIVSTYLQTAYLPMLGDNSFTHQRLLKMSPCNRVKWTAPSTWVFSVVVSTLWNNLLEGVRRAPIMLQNAQNQICSEGCFHQGIRWNSKVDIFIREKDYSLLQCLWYIMP